MWAFINTRWALSVDVSHLSSRKLLCKLELNVIGMMLWRSSITFFIHFYLTKYMTARGNSCFWFANNKFQLEQNMNEGIMLWRYLQNFSFILIGRKLILLFLIYQWLLKNHALLKYYANWNQTLKDRCFEDPQQTLRI